MSVADTAAPAQDSVWRCPKCNRAFRRTRQPHSCRTVSLESHLRHGEQRAHFEHLVDEVNSKVGRCEVLSLPCCIHLVGKFDFLAVLAKKERLEIRFVLKRELASSRVQRSARISKTQYKHCVDVQAAEDIDEELLSWVREAYYLERR